MPRFNIRHVTRYSYAEPVRDSANQVMLFPIQDEFQEVNRHELQISGDPAVSVYQDYYGNEVGSFTYAEPHKELMIDSRIDVVVKFRTLPPDTEDKGRQWSLLQGIKNTYPYIDFTKQETLLHIDELAALPFIIDSKSHTPLEASRRLNEYVYRNFSYNKTVTDVETTFDEVWTLRAGVCQDFAHVLLVLLRLIDIPARYVSGYICPNKNGMRGEGATHAWVEAYIPGFGWLGLDPTNNCLVQDLHVRLATGRSFRDVSPVKGTYKGTSDHQLEVGVTVSYEDGATITEQPAMLVTQPAKPAPGIQSNSYRRHLEMIQQQQ